MTKEEIFKEQHERFQKVGCYIPKTESNFVDNLDATYKKGLSDGERYTIQKVIKILSDTGYFQFLSSQEGMSEEVFEEQFRKCIEEE